MRWRSDGFLDELSVPCVPKQSAPFYPGDVIEFDEETGLGLVALNHAATRDGLMLSQPLQLRYPRLIMELLDGEQPTTSPA